MRDKTKISILFICLIVSLNAEIPLSYPVENTGKDCNKPDLPEPNLLKKVNNLPNPFEWTDGSGTISSLDDWKCRRNEIKAEIEKYEIGIKPDTAKVEASYEGGSLKVIITDNGQSLTLTSSINVPSGNGPFPIIIGMNSGTGSLDKSLFSDFIQVPFLHDQVAKYSMSGVKDTNVGFYKIYPNLRNNGDYSAWAWGVSRLIDGLEQIQDKINGDLSRIVVVLMLERWLYFLVLLMKELL